MNIAEIAKLRMTQEEMLCRYHNDPVVHDFVQRAVAEALASERGYTDLKRENEELRLRVRRG